MDTIIRTIREEEISVLNDFLYEAIFIPEGVEKPSRAIIERPELQVYVENFGQRTDDLCFVAECDGVIVGAVWTRLMNDYGHVDDKTPSLAISLYAEYRGFGLGTLLLQTILKELSCLGYHAVSLSVQKANRVARLYQRLGFRIIKEEGEEYIMVCDLKGK